MMNDTKKGEVVQSCSQFSFSKDDDDEDDDSEIFDDEKVHDEIDFDDNFDNDVENSLINLKPKVVKQSQRSQHGQVF